MKPTASDKPPCTVVTLRKPGDLPGPANAEPDQLEWPAAVVEFLRYCRARGGIAPDEPACVQFLQDNPRWRKGSIPYATMLVTQTEAWLRMFPLRANTL